jgi:hypothetical protein
MNYVLGLIVIVFLGVFDFCGVLVQCATKLTVRQVRMFAYPRSHRNGVIQTANVSGLGFALEMLLNNILLCVIPHIRHYGLSIDCWLRCVCSLEFPHVVPDHAVQTI